MTESLKKKTFKGVVWSSLERFSVQGLQFIVMIIMARLLTPGDYGLVGMLAIFIAISQSLIDSGFSQALIRKQDRDEIDNSTVFYFNVVVGVVLYGILFVCSPLIAQFYKEPSLTLLTRVVCLSVVFNSIVVVQRALLTIRIDFKTQAKASAAGAIVSGSVGIVMAYSGCGVWAIVAQQLLNQLVTGLLLWLFSGWRPIMAYSWTSFKELFSFGSKLAVSGLIDTVYRNLYLIVIGKFFNASDLGFYTRAHQFSEFPSSNVTGVVQRVTFPVLCSMQAEDERLQVAYRNFLRISAFVVFPLMMGLAGVARPFVIVVLKEQWEFAGELLQILCFAMMWYPVHAINLNLLQVKGRSDLFLKLEVYKKLIGACVIIATVPMGIVAMCYGAILTSLISLVINTYYTGKLINVGLFRQVLDLVPAMSYSFSMFMVVYLTVHLVSVPGYSLLAGIVAGLIYFFVVTVITRSRDLKELISIVKRR